MNEKRNKILASVFVVAVLIVVVFFGTRGVKMQAVNSPQRGVVDGLDTNQLPLPRDPTSVSRVITDKKTNREYMSNQLIVEFLPDVTIEESLKIIEAAGGAYIARFTAAPLFLVQAKDEGDGKGAAIVLGKLSKEPKVKNADYNYLTNAPTPQIP